MRTLEVNLTVKQDGKLLAGFPLFRRLQVDELQAFSTEQASGGGYVTPPIGELATLQFLVLSPSQAVTLRFANQSDAGLALNTGALLILIDANLASGATTNLKIDNSSGSLAVLDGLAGGT